MPPTSKADFQTVGFVFKKFDFENIKNLLQDDAFALRENCSEKSLY